LNPRKLLRLAAALGAVATAAGVTIVALAYTLFAVARDYIGTAGAAAVVAAVFAVVAVVVAIVATRKAKLPPPSMQPEPPIAARLIQFARERPLLALGAVAAAGVVAARNPAIISAVVSAFLAGSATKPDPKA
jgi:hypothetical protein